MAESCEYKWPDTADRLNRTDVDHQDDTGVVVADTGAGQILGQDPGLGLGEEVIDVPEAEANLMTAGQEAVAEVAPGADQGQINLQGQRDQGQEHLQRKHKRTMQTERDVLEVCVIIVGTDTIFLSSFYQRLLSCWSLKLHKTKKHF